MERIAIITAERLKQLSPTAKDDIVNPLAPILETVLPSAGIYTPLRRAHFLAQICVESWYFRSMEESFYYSTPERVAKIFPKLSGRAADLARHPMALANAAYAGRLGNRDEASGDGWRYRGRGLIQLTGRMNYRNAGAALGMGLEDNPDDACQPRTAVVVALWFWSSRGCSSMADADDGDAITRAINGPAKLEATMRQDLADKAKGIFV